MRQVLFWIPIPNPWFPDGFPVYGFGLILFLTFITCTLWAGWRARKEGISPAYLQDLAVWIFIGGIIGARITYMIQYKVPVQQFFEIWKGGLVFYGSAVGGALGYLAAYFFVIKKHGLSTRQLADIIAPTVAWGLMLGRIGCLLNGCCYGHVACEHCAGQFPAVHFPLGAPPRYTLVQGGLQTAAGFTLKDRGLQDDPRSVVGAVEAGSPAAESGLRPGDVVLAVNGKPNRRIIEVKGQAGVVNALAQQLGGHTTVLTADDSGETVQFAFDNADDYRKALDKLRQEPVTIQAEYDTLWDALVYNWPRGKDDLDLTVRHADGTEAELTFVPRTLGLHPTQLYEAISMLLLFLLLNAFFPFRRHYGEVFVLLMFCYAIHRFLNETLRNDTDPVAFGMTLSQNGSLIVIVLSAILFVWLWRRPPDRELLPPEPEVKGEPAAVPS